jgi:hypothetical protein
MPEKLSIPKIIIKFRIWHLFVFVLAILSLYQTFLITNNYIRIMREPLWRMRTMNSFDRSKILYLKPYRATYMNFLDSIIPARAEVATDTSPVLGQSVLQFYLGSSRVVIACPESGKEQLSCLEKPDLYVPAIDDFPPATTVAQKILIPYNPDDYKIPGIYSEHSQASKFKGIYVPTDYKIDTPSFIQYPVYRLFPTLLIDLFVLVSFIFLGSIMVAVLLKEPSLVTTLILSLPLGAGLFSFTLFVISWSGIPLTLGMVIITFAILAIILLMMRWHQTRPHFHIFKVDHPLMVRNPLMDMNCVIFRWIIGFLGLTLAFLVITGVIISVGRGYSLFDDLAIWSLKGYVIADKNSIMAASQRSGHGLAYPLNLSLVVSVFRLVSDDLLPGSKFIFFLLNISLLAGIYHYWRNLRVPTILALNGILVMISTPVIYMHSTYGFSNLPFTAYLVLGTLWSIDGFIRDRKEIIITGGLLLAFAGWTRPEGIGYSLVIAFSLLLFQWLIKEKFNYFPLWLASILTIPVVWFIFSQQYIGEGQIGGALKALINSFKEGTYRFENIRYIVVVSLELLKDVKNWGYLFPLMLLGIVLSLPEVLHRNNSIKRHIYLLIPVVLITILGPIVLFYVESFTESDHYTFMLVSFDRAFFPAVVFTTIFAILGLGGNSSEDNL